MRDRLIEDLLVENHELDTFLSGLADSDWDRHTPFFDWTVRDQVLHLHQVDRFGVISLTGKAPFADTVARVRAHQAQGVELSQAIRSEFADVSAANVLLIWREGYRQVADVLRNAPDGRRLDWFGPPMGIASFASARLMEVWAHGQDIYDLFAVRRPPTQRLRHICELGVRTFAWSFRNRGLSVPQRPAVKLSAPGGETWDWPGEGGADLIEGPAHDFSLLVTQRRAPADTRLIAQGAAARAWLDIAQCFAGAPQQAAIPGARPAI